MLNKVGVFKRVRPLSLEWTFMQRCFKVSGQTHRGKALDIGTIALKFSHVCIAWLCSMLSHKQLDSAAVRLGELTLPDSFIHTQHRVEFMLGKMVAKFVTRKCSMSFTGNYWVSIGFV